MSSCLRGAMRGGKKKRKEKKKKEKEKEKRVTKDSFKRLTKKLIDERERARGGAAAENEDKKDGVASVVVVGALYIHRLYFLPVLYLICR